MMIYSEDWARQNSFTPEQVEREILKHGADPKDFFRDIYSDGLPPQGMIPGATVLDWLEY